MTTDTDLILSADQERRAMNLYGNACDIAALMRELIYLRDEVDKMKSKLFTPTHRHVEGGLYERKRRVRVKIGDAWVDFIGYVSGDGHHYARLPADFDARFEKLPEPPA